MAEAQEGPIQKGFEGQLGIFTDVSDEGKEYYRYRILHLDLWWWWWGHTQTNKNQAQITINIQLKPTLFTSQKEQVHFLSAVIDKLKLKT